MFSIINIPYNFNFLSLYYLICYTNSSIVLLQLQKAAACALELRDRSSVNEIGFDIGLDLLYWLLLEVGGVQGFHLAFPTMVTFTSLARNNVDRRLYQLLCTCAPINYQELGK